jgi:hypothetical protein
VRMQVRTVALESHRGICPLSIQASVGPPNSHFRHIFVEPSIRRSSVALLL